MTNVTKQLEAKINARVRELLAAREQVMIERLAQERVAEIVKTLGNGHAKPKRRKAAKHKPGHNPPPRLPPDAVLRRGDVKQLERFRASKTKEIVLRAFEALSRGGHFANKATRADMEAYLAAHESIKPASADLIAFAVGRALQFGILVTEEAGNG